MKRPIRLFCGYDTRQPAGTMAFIHSVLVRSSLPVSFSILSGNTLRGVYDAPLMREGASTEFAFTRFLVPFLCQYEGWAIFADAADMICTADIAKLWDMRDPDYAVQVVKNNHNPENKTKFLGQAQQRFPMKNWSSLILFNNAMCRDLTPDYVAKASGATLHQFKWLGDYRDQLMGALPKEWNQLVDINEEDMLKEGIMHWTNGSPYFPETEFTDEARVWFREVSRMLGDELEYVG